jgi:hypothetical protein
MQSAGLILCWLGMEEYDDVMGESWIGVVIFMNLN